MARHKKTPTETHGNGDLAAKSATLSRNASASVDHYVAKRIRRRRHKVARNILITLASLIVLAGAAMAAYVYHINTQLTGGLSPDLSSALTSTEAGRPFYVLLLGIDKDEGRSEGPEYGSSDSAYRSDSIMLARVDPQEKKVTLVSIHRDTLVNLGSYGEQKINAAFAFGGPAYATQVISQFSGVSISHYAQIDMDGMAQAVDAVGGVTVNLPTPVKDPQYTGLDLPAGEQTIDGRTAALLSRARHAYDAYGDGDLYRAANQRAVIMAVMKKVLASDPVTMVNTINTMAGMIKTD
ncbi:LCP family protein, partial [Olsenella sp. HMSC062G07]|uniref:LCP family protein n=1 Tax=Olsenella sp. HMSC062G07 TaxID=1739330 RepID=UPI000ABE60B1